MVAIVGRANVGKSSLFNAILGRRETIVAREPGTTRDSIMVKANFKARDFWLVDTAGLKDPSDEFELNIQDQIKETSAAADVTIMVVEADVPPVEEDRRLATLALKSKKPVILVVNKIDKVLRDADLSQWQKLGIKDIVATSTTQRLGLEELLNKLFKVLIPTSIKPTKTMIRLAILGRPNVGKSSLFNALAAKQQALVAPQAGTTRDVNRLSLSYHQQTIEIADTAGIRRSGKIERGVEHFSVLRTVAAIEEADICLLLMDINELNVQLDQKIAGMVKTAGKGLVLVVSKWDLLKDKASHTDISNTIDAS